MYRLLISCLLFACAYAQTENVESVTAKAYNGTEGTTPAPVTTTGAPIRRTEIILDRCITRDKGRGLCLPYFLCNEDGSVNTNGLGILDQRGGPPSGARKEYLDDLRKRILGMVQRTSTPAPPAGDADDADYEQGRPLDFVRERPCRRGVCCTLFTEVPRPDITAPAHTPPQNPVCGQRQLDGVGFYYTRQATEEAKFAEFPWTVAVFYEDESVNDLEGGKPEVYISTGSLIHPSVVLTAAHFDIEKSTFKVRAGIISIKANRFENELYPHQDRYVEDVKVHEDYDKHLLLYDVALLFLASPMILAPNVGVVCLPPQNNRLPKNIRCIGSGWGRETFRTNVTYRTQLKKFDLTLVDRYACEELMKHTRLGPFFKLDESFTCARDDSEKDRCQGDGGSPLVCPIVGENTRYQQQGVASWGIGCGNKGIPLVYADLSGARAWIDRAVIAKGFDPQVYNV